MLYCHAFILSHVCVYCVPTFHTHHVFHCSRQYERNISFHPEVSFSNDCESDEEVILESSTNVITIDESDTIGTMEAAT